MTAQLEFTAEELLADHRVAEPLVAGGVRCHGGFDDGGRYVSPRGTGCRPSPPGRSSTAACSAPRSSTSR